MGNSAVIIVSTGMVSLPPNRGGGIERSIWNILEMFNLINDAPRVIVVSRVNNEYAHANLPKSIQIINSHSPIDRFPLPPFLSSIAHIIGGVTSTIATVLYLRKISKNNSKFIIHVHEEISGFLLSHILKNIPIIQTIHNPPPEWGIRKTGLEGALRKIGAFLTFSLTAKKAKLILAQSEFVKSYLNSIRRISPAKIMLYYPPIDTETFRPREEGKNINSGTAFNLLFVGRLERRKNVELLLHLMRKLPKDINLTIVGSGPLYNEFNKFVRDNELGRNVTITGRVDQDILVSYYQDANCFILPSSLELNPQVITEAASCGLPTLIPRLEMYHHLLNEEFCLFYDYNNIEDLASKVMELRFDKELREKMSISGRKYALNSVSFQVSATLLSTIYSRMLDNVI